ncbi:MAG: hypothetical protein NTV06_00305, partial [candidate division Zixibacteria bacterium]|nr:hypothetical protein [candidate division Zixibacteria bacterium]
MNACGDSVSYPPGVLKKCMLWQCASIMTNDDARPVILAKARIEKVVTDLHLYFCFLDPESRRLCHNYYFGMVLNIVSSMVRVQDFAAVNPLEGK